MIRISFNGSDERLIASMKARGPQIREGLRLGLEQGMIELQARIQRKLSGEVLQSRGGGLLGSVRMQPIIATDQSITGGVQAGGGLHWWAKVHEWGGNTAYEIWPVNKKALAFFPGGSAGAVVQSGVFASQGFGRSAMTKIIERMGARRGMIRPGKVGAFGKAGGIVRKFVVHPPLPRRAFMGPALEEMRGTIIQKIFAAAAAAVR